MPATPGASPIRLRSSSDPAPVACHQELATIRTMPARAIPAAGSARSVRRCSSAATVMPAPNSTKWGSSDVLSVCGQWWV
jgi:hypothetical protein